MLANQPGLLACQKWIFAECVRRTILIAYAIIGLFELLKDPEDPGNE